MGRAKVVPSPPNGDNTTEAMLHDLEYAPLRWSAWPWNHNEPKSDRASMSSSLDDDNPTFDRRTMFTRSGRRPQSYCKSAAATLSILCLAVYVLATAPMLLRTALSQRNFTCGTTIDEALARGCTFDPLTVQWLPKQCSRVGVDEFLFGNHSSFSRTKSKLAASYLDRDAREPTWHYFADKNHTEEYIGGLSTAPLGHRVYWTTRGEHLTHCTYILIRGAEARAAGKRLDTLSGDPVHTRHCALFLYEYARKDPYFDTVNTAGDIKLGAC